MRTKLILTALVCTTVFMSSHAVQARDGFPAPPLPPPPLLLPPPPPGPPGVNVSVSGYLPAPPGVHVYVDSGRPYYVERERRIYLKKRGPKYYKYKHVKHGHKDHGRKHGHGKH